MILLIDTIPAFAGDTLVYYLIGLLLCFVISAVVMYVLGIEEEEVDSDLQEQTSASVQSPAASTKRVATV